MNTLLQNLVLLLCCIQVLFSSLVTESMLVLVLVLLLVLVLVLLLVLVLA